MIFDFNDVSVDVGEAMRRIICSKTRFKDHTDKYNPAIVPKKAFPKGIDADMRAEFWRGLVRLVIDVLVEMNKGYGVVYFDIADAENTLGSPISDTAFLLTQRIVQGPGHTA